jgi:hypothetical protein
MNEDFEERAALINRKVFLVDNFDFIFCNSKQRLSNLFFEDKGERKYQLIFIQISIYLSTLFSLISLTILILSAYTKVFENIQGSFKIIIGIASLGFCLTLPICFIFLAVSLFIQKSILCFRSDTIERYDEIRNYKPKLINAHYVLSLGGVDHFERSLFFIKESTDLSPDLTNKDKDSIILVRKSFEIDNERHVQQLNKFVNYGYDLDYDFDEEQKNTIENFINENETSEIISDFVMCSVPFFLSILFCSLPLFELCYLSKIPKKTVFVHKKFELITQE